MDYQNVWGLAVSKVDLEDKFNSDELAEFNIPKEKDAREKFGRVKEMFVFEKDDFTDELYTVELLDYDGKIVDEHDIGKEQLNAVLKFIGGDVNE